MKIATAFAKKLEFTPFSKKTNLTFEEFLNVLYPKKESENRHHILQKLEFTPFSKKTHPKFEEFLNVLYCS
jgi:Uma2 family endonuclease